jgi:hypothetical protein
MVHCVVGNVSTGHETSNCWGQCLAGDARQEFAPLLVCQGRVFFHDRGGDKPTLQQDAQHLLPIRMFF